jgi:hypothetical protein
MEVVNMRGMEVIMEEVMEEATAVTGKIMASGIGMEDIPMEGGEVVDISLVDRLRTRRCTRMPRSSSSSITTTPGWAPLTSSITTIRRIGRVSGSIGLIQNPPCL